MKKILIAAAAMVALTAVPMFSATSQADLQKQAKITMKQARKTALSKAAGKVTSEELENEGGKLIYSFDIKTKRDVTEVNVDAMNGKVVAVQHENAAKEAAEAKADAQAAAKAKSAKPVAAKKQ